MKTDSGPHSTSFLLNNRLVSLRDVGVHTTLLDYIRAQGLTGAKEGCAEGECGACTVVLVANRANGSEYRAVNSCLVLAPMAAGQEIYTVEALAADGKLAEVQHAMAAGGGSQCGYCTPGFVMSMFAEQYRPGRAGPCDPHELGGNLCRCTGYRPIRDAALSLGPAAMRELFSIACRSPAPKLEADRVSRMRARDSRVLPSSRTNVCRSWPIDPDARVDFRRHRPGGGIESPRAALVSPGERGSDRRTSRVFRDSAVQSPSARRSR